MSRLECSNGAIDVGVWRADIEIDLYPAGSVDAVASILLSIDQAERLVLELQATIRDRRAYKLIKSKEE